jgi:hypothetical protein
MSDTNEFYDVKISQDIISEKEKNDITNRLMKNEKKNSHSKESDSKLWYNNKCFVLSALILSSTVIATGVYMCYLFC